MILIVNYQSTEGIYINLSQRHFEVSNKACAPSLQSFRGPNTKHPVIVQFTPKYRRPARQLRLELSAAFRTFNVSVAQIIKNNTFTC